MADKDDAPEEETKQNDKHNWGAADLEKVSVTEFKSSLSSQKLSRFSPKGFCLKCREWRVIGHKTLFLKGFRFYFAYEISAQASLAYYHTLTWSVSRIICFLL